MYLKIFQAASLATLLASCTVVGPDFKRPAIGLADNFAFTSKAHLRDAADDQWWTGLKDPVLNDLMQRGLTQNLSLQAAVSRIREAEAVLATTGVNAALTGDLTGTATARLANGTETTQRSAQFAPTFVIDLFGGQQREREAALASRDAAIFDEAAARLALHLSLVSTYLDLRYFQSLETLTHRNIRSQSRVVDTLQDRYQVNEETKVSLRRAEADLELLRANLPQRRTDIETTILALATLLAEPGQKLIAELGGRASGQPSPPRGMSPGVPAALLQNRPDIRAAEARLASAVAAIGVQEAELYPSLRLGGSVTLGATNSVQVGPSLTLPILGQKVREARRVSAAERAIQADIEWRQTVLEGIEEVETNLSILKNADRQLTALNRALRVTRDYAELSRESFALGETTVLEIIDAEEDLTSTEQSLALARRQYAKAWAGLNVAIGQGWHVQAQGLGDADSVTAGPATH